MKNLLKDEMLLANFVSNLFYTTAYGTVNFYIISSIGPQMLNVSAVIACIAGIITPILWNKYGDCLFKYYRVFLVAEIVIAISLYLMLSMEQIPIKLFYILDTLLYALCTGNILAGNNKIKSVRYDGKERELYDNNSQMVANVSSVIGFSMGIILKLPLQVSIIMFGVGAILDNVIYLKLSKKYI